MVYYLWREGEREKIDGRSRRWRRIWNNVSLWLDIENLDGGKFYNKFCCHCFCRVFFFDTLFLFLRIKWYKNKNKNNRKWSYQIFVSISNLLKLSLFIIRSCEPRIILSNDEYIICVIQIVFETWFFFKRWYTRYCSHDEPFARYEDDLESR